MGQIHEMPFKSADSRPSRSEVLEALSSELRAIIATGRDPSSADILLPLLDRYKDKFEEARVDLGTGNFLDQYIISNLMNPYSRAEIFAVMRKEVEEEQKQKQKDEPREMHKAA